MAVTINGTTGIAGVDGSASTPAVQGSDTNTGIFFPAADTIAFGEGGTEVMRIDSSGRVGIGTSSPGSYNNDGNQLVVGSGSGNQGLTISAGATSLASIFFAKGTAGSDPVKAFIKADGNTEYLAFGTANAERARITSGGKFCVGTTGFTSGAEGFIEIAGDVQNVRNLLATDNTAAGSTSFSFFAFKRNGTLTGTISNTNAATAFNTTSDYRLKENIAPMTGALATVAQLKPVTYTWKDGGESGQGFIAHELQEVCPDAVTGEKDAVDADGIPQYQGVDTSFLVATLTAAIQELNTKVETLEAQNAAFEARLAALEAK